MKRRRNLEESLSKACAVKCRQGGYDDPATPEAWEAWDYYTMSLSYPSPGNPVPDPKTLTNTVMDFEYHWLSQNHPELLQYATCRRVRPTLLKDVIGTFLLALVVAWFSIAFFDSVSVTLIAIALYLVGAALWCRGQHKLYRDELRQFCQLYEDT